MIMAQTVAGAGVLLVAFGGMLFGAIATALVLSYVWGARETARERWMQRFRRRIRRRLRNHADDESTDRRGAQSPTA